MNEMLDFVKAMSNPDRLRIIGLLSQKPSTRSEIMERLSLTTKEVVDHLAYLEHVEAISQSGNTYLLNNDRLAVLAREKLSQERASFVPENDADANTKKVLKTFLNPDGSIRQIPSQPKLQVVLEYLVKAFEFNTDYTEKDVNTILRRFNEDTAGLRRDLVDAGLLARESNGSRYWRVV
jgi:hypothetical protein